MAASVAPVVASAAPMTEAAFGRKRGAAIANAVTSSASKRARVAPDMTWVQQADDPEMTPAPMCVEGVAKRVEQQAGKTAAIVVAKRENKWCDQASKCHWHQGRNPALLAFSWFSPQRRLQFARLVGVGLS